MDWLTNCHCFWSELHLTVKLILSPVFVFHFALLNNLYHIFFSSGIWSLGGSWRFRRGCCCAISGLKELHGKVMNCYFTCWRFPWSVNYLLVNVLLDMTEHSEDFHMWDMEMYLQNTIHYHRTKSCSGMFINTCIVCWPKWLDTTKIKNYDLTMILQPPLLLYYLPYVAMKLCTPWRRSCYGDRGLVSILVYFWLFHLQPLPMESFCFYKQL